MYEFENSPRQNYENGQTPPQYAAVDPRARLARTAFFLAIISIPLCMTGYLSLMVAGVAFVIAVITLDEHRRALPQAKRAIYISLFVIGFSLAIIIRAFATVVLPALRSPEMMAELDAYLKETTGTSLTELMEQLYGN